MRIKYYRPDCASDSISTHLLLVNDGIVPLIDINKRKGSENPYTAYEKLSAAGKHICPGGFEMAC